MSNSKSKPPVSIRKVTGARGGRTWDAAPRWYVDIRWSTSSERHGPFYSRAAANIQAAIDTARYAAVQARIAARKALNA